jgi:hypothetical protein
MALEMKEKGCRRKEAKYSGSTQQSTERSKRKCLGNPG